MSPPARAADIVFTRHGARRGLAWLGEAYAMFKRARLAWLMLIALYWLIIVVANKLPIVGQLMYPLLRPVFAVGLLAAAWTQERGGRPTAAHLFKGFRANLPALLALGGMSVVGVAAAVFLTAMLDGGLLFDLLSGGAGSPDAATDAASMEALIRSGKLGPSLMLLVALTMPTVLALWFAPALVVFHDVGPLVALGASLRATLANWRPIAIYIVAVIAFGALVPLVIAQVVGMLVPVAVDVVRIAFLAYGLMFAATLHISDYVSYRDVFHAGETLTPIGDSASEPND